LSEQTGAALGMWATPRASDGEKGGPNQSFGAGGQPLPSQAYQSAQAEASGPTPNGSSDTTAKPAGSLNPAFVSWLMGYPPEWGNCAPMAMPLSPKSRRKS
jgi:hypothetical protein